jgi:hypothetical protein
MVRAFVSLRHVPLGFGPSRVLTMNVEIHHPGGRPIEDRLAFFSRVADEIRRLPGVAKAALGLPIPLSKSRLTQRHAIDQRSPQSPGSVMRHMIPGQGIPAGGVAPPSHMSNLLGRRALPSGRRAPGLRPRITLPGD